ncbi:MAG: carbohydrate-binding domain-containing protein [Anaerolineae bacterium]
MRRFTLLLFATAMLFNLVACAGHSAATTSSAAAAATQPIRTSAIQSAATATPRPAATTIPAPTAIKYDSADLDVVAAGEATEIRLQGDKILITGSGATVNGTIVTVTKAGTYRISGKLDDGQIVVDTADTKKVVLLLDGADITHATGAAIYVANAEKVVITLAEGTQNRVADGAQYVFPDAQTDEPDAAIFSHDDLTINGAGALTVQANYKNGIVGKDDLKITGGTIIVDAVNDGIRGRDSLAIKDGTITVRAGGDGLQANNDKEADQGYIVIEGGTLDITAGKDAVQAETNLTVSGGQLALRAGGGSSVRKTAESAKGLKAGVDIVITGGTIRVDSSDDAINANNTVTIAGGELILATSDDGVRANSAFTMTGGDLRITRSYEGIESNQIMINDGTIRLVSSDDGINGTSATAAGPMPAGPMPGRGGPGGFEAGDSRLTIHSGYIAVDALGDGIDINGAVEMTGGTLLVNGPTDNFNGALDHISFKITGGLLVAVGSAGMAMAPDTTSTQYSLMHTFPSVQAAGTLIHVASKDGQEIVTFAPIRSYQSVVVSSPALAQGGTYVVYSGGRSTGTVADGLVTGGRYTPGTQVATYTLTSVVTGARPGMGGMPGMPGGRGVRPVQP